MSGEHRVEPPREFVRAMQALSDGRMADGGWLRLGGSDEHGETWLYADAGRRLVLKRFAPSEFAEARLTASVCSGGLFHTVIAGDEAASLLVFEHVPGRSLASLLAVGSDQDARLDLAGRYVDHVRATLEYLRFLRRPEPLGGLSLSPLLGLPRPTSASRQIDSVSGVVIALGGLLTGVHLDESRPASLGAADRDLAHMIRQDVGEARCWIASDTNPANLIVRPTEEFTMVDVQLRLGVPETALVPLGGPAFDLPDDVADALVLQHEEFAADRWHLVNAYFALCSTLDTLSGLADGSRDGLTAVPLTLSDVVAASVDSSRSHFARVPAGDAYLPALGELRETLDRADVRSRLASIESRGRACVRH
jgi:hypothetical protein